MNEELQELKQKWNDILYFLERDLGITTVSIDTWIRPLKIENIKDNTVILSSDPGRVGPNGVSFISNRYGIDIKNAIASILGKQYELSFVSLSKNNDSVPAAADYVKNPAYQFLNPKYTFENYVVSSNNELAHAAALAAAESPADVYNPLFIYGNAGLGKTHLMQAIALHIINSNPKLNVMYVQSEQFTNELIDSIRNKNSDPSSFREKYRNVDVLLIDDIQFIIGKDRTQEEFFNTFNDLYNSKKQIVISSDKPPKDFVDLDERYRSRFGWGLIVDITSPDFETKMAILRKKVELLNVNVPNEVTEYIALNIKSNIRDLEGSLTKLVALSRFQHRDITLDLAKDSLTEFISGEKRNTLTYTDIIEVVAEHYKISASDITGAKKDKDLAYPRQIVMYLCSTLLDTTQKKIGDNLGGRDHSTVLHGIKKIKEDIASDVDVKKTIDVLIKKINPDR